MSWVNITDIIYPIGSVYKTSLTSSPADAFGGTWELINSGYDRIYVGNQILHSGTSGSGLTSGWVSVIGAYNYELIQGVFDGYEIPTGYHKEYRLSFLGNTRNANRIAMALNNISTAAIGTWSAVTFRKPAFSDFFKESDLVLETTVGYSSEGINLKYQVSSVDGYAWQWWDAAIHGYAVSDKEVYTWERVA